MMIYLSPFCSTDPGREHIRKPFSHGAFTYATNGHILVCVPLRAGYAANAQGPNVDRIMEFHKGATFSPLPVVRWPKIPEPPACAVCEGRGTEHDCPECRCKCDACDGTGRIHDETGSVGVRGAIFAIKYIKIIASLPLAEFSEKPSVTYPCPFRFDGGCGVVMPMRGQSNFWHVGDIEALAP